MGQNITGEELFRLKAKASTEALLKRIIRFHGTNEKKLIAKPVKREPLLCEKCRDPIYVKGAPPRIYEIKRAVSEYFRLHERDLESACKISHIIYPRQICMYLARILTARGTKEIGRRLGNRDHTTVIYGARKIEHLVKTDWKIAYDVAHVEAML